MSWRTNIILLLILVVLGAWYFFYEIQGAPQREKEVIEAKRLFPGLASEDILTFSFQRIPNTTEPELAQPLQFGFESIDSKWSITSPIQYPAETETINEMVKTIAELQSERSLPDASDHRSDFGLDKPSFIVTFNSKDVQYQVMLGDENPTQDYFYAEISNGKDVYLVPNTFKDSLTKDLMHYRDKRIIPITQKEIGKLEYQIAASEGSPSPIVITAKEDQWELVTPMQAPADRTRINELVSSLEAQEIQSFVSETNESLAQYGLDKPYLSVSIALKDSDAVIRLLFGKNSDAGGKYRYALREGSAPIFTVNEDLVKKFSADPFEMRSKDVCQFERSRVKKFTLTNRHGTFSLTRAGESDWQLISPRELPTDSSAAGGILSDLAFLKATGLKPDLIDFGEDHITMDLFDDPASQEPFLHVVVGGKPEDGVGRWLKTSQGETIFRISDTDVDRFIRDEFHFRNKIIMEFGIDELVQVHVIKSGRELVFRHDGDDFEIVSPKETSISNQSLETLVWAINRLRMDALVEEATPDSKPDLNQYGLQNPSITIKVQLNDKSLGPVYLGADTADGESIYVTTESADIIASIKKSAIQELLDVKI